MRIPDEAREVRALLIGDVPDAVPADRDLIVVRRDRRERRVPSRVQRRVRKPRERRVEEIVARRERLDLLERRVAVPMTVTADWVSVPLAKVVRYPRSRRGWKASRMKGNALG